MTPDQLREAQRTLGCQPADMMKLLQTKRRTYQDWLAGRRPIPGICEAAIKLLLEKNARFMENIGKRQQTTAPPFQE